MQIFIQKTTAKRVLNRLVRMTQRVEITQLTTQTVTVRNVYKNKQVIEVTSNTLSRCCSKI